MNKNIRIIPRLDIKGPNLVKGIHLEGLRVLGKPSEFAKFYYENGADELLYMDVVASLYERNSLQSLIEQTANEIFIPLTVGGGIRTVQDIKNVLRSGADKVCLNTAVIKNPNLIREAAEKFGSSTIVVAIEAIKQPNGEYFAFIDNGREYTGVEVVDWAAKVAEFGAGELVITSVDKEGTGKGFDLDLIEKVSNVVNMPVIAHGGPGSKQDVLELLHNSDCDAVCLSSILHYEYIKLVDYKETDTSEGNFDFLRSGQSAKRISSLTIADLKEFLFMNNISIRKNV